HARGTLHKADSSRRAAAALERAARRHELRRPATRTAVLRAAARRRGPLLHATARRQTRRHRLGPGEVPVRRVDRRRDGEAALRPVLHQAPVDRFRPHDRDRYGQGHPVRQGRQVMRTTEGQIGAPQDETLAVARNVSTRYLAIAAEMAIGILVLPFNVAHLGKSAYGLWVLTTSITAYFSVLDLGYSGALVKFVAQYRAKHDTRALNEILSTTFYLFTLFGVITYVAAMIIAALLDRVLHIPSDQLYIARVVLLVTTVNVAVGTAFTVFGAVINGFQRYDINNITGTVSGILAALVNVAVLWMGYGLIPLVI